MRFSVIVPTHRRRDLVLALLHGLEHQTCTDFEAIVVVDGADDDVVAALRGLDPQIELTVLAQPHRGAAAARNTGAAAARGEILLFLDDDMVPDPTLLAAHDRAHRAGADVVLGHMPLAPTSPQTAAAATVRRWAERRRDRLAGSEVVPVPDLLTGQLSISRTAFDVLGGFDVGFTRGGLVPGADRDFGYRARRHGLRIVFDADAVSHQHYDIDAAEYTRRSRDGARGDEILKARYPEIAHELWPAVFHTRTASLTLGTLARLPRPLSAPIRAAAIRAFSPGGPSTLRNRFFFAVQTMERRRGARDARRALQSPLAVVLAYHAVADLSHDRRLADYGIPAGRLAAQLDALARSGWQFVGLSTFLDALDGRSALPERALLVTFDDAYADFGAAARPVLQERGIPAVVFAVSDLVGTTNDWRRSDASVVPLLDADGLRDASAAGFDVGSHGATHTPLTALDGAELEREIRGSAERLAALGLPRPVVFSYPHGEHDEAARAAVADAGYRAAFTVVPGVVNRAADRFALPRLEVLATETDDALRSKLARVTRRRR